MGRPTLYRPDHCALVVQCGKDGKSLHQTSSILDISVQTLYEWQKRYPDFADAITRAREFAQAWWEDKAQAGLGDRNFNPRLWEFQARNRFPTSYRDISRTEITGADGGPVELGRADRDGILAEVKRRGLRMARREPVKGPAV